MKRVTARITRHQVIGNVSLHRFDYSIVYVK